MRARILIVEDDPSVGEVMVASLAKEGYETILETDGAGALKRWQDDGDFALVVLDVVLPSLDGLSVCRAIRETSDVPIMMLTGKVDAGSVVIGLEVGADDYVRKPFDLIELKARVRALLRRTGGNGQERTIQLGELMIDAAGGRVTKSGRPISLSAMEFKLLLEFAKSPGRVMTRDALLRRVWDYDYLGDSRLVDMAIKRLRDKIEDDPTKPVWISTVRGLGYRFEAA